MFYCREVSVSRFPRKEIETNIHEKITYFWIDFVLFVKCINFLEIIFWRLYLVKEPISVDYTEKLDKKPKGTDSAPLRKSNCAR